MTREEAIEMLKALNMMLRSPNGEPISDVCDALGIAIEALHREEAEEKGYCHRIRPSNVEVVVRCKDCKNWRESHSEDEESYCYIDGRTTDSTDFCSWGERKEP